MKKTSQEQKDFYLIAKKIQNQSSSPHKNDARNAPSQFDRQSEEALKMIEAYRKVQNLKPTLNNKIQKQTQQQKQPPISQQPKSTYATKIKETLRQLNANKAKQYEKLSQKNIEIKSQPKSLQVVNQQAFKAKSQQQKKLILKAVEKIYLLLGNLFKKTKKNTFLAIIAHSQSILQNQYAMAKKYRLFRLFSLWKSQAKLLKIENQRKRKQDKQKQLSATELAHEFRIFSLSKKVLKHWAKVAKMEKKKRKYQQELQQIEAERNIANKNQPVQVPQRNLESHNSTNDQLQNKLKGFLNGLKQKIQTKDHKSQLHAISQHAEESQQASHVFTQPPEHQQPSQEQPHQNQLEAENQSDQPHPNQQPKQPLSNEALQKNRQQIYQRSKQRKQALQKLKKQKQLQKRKDQEERKQLEKQIQEENKRIKQLKYKEFQQRKKLQKEWEQREIELCAKADQWNRLRILKWYGFDHWKSLKNQNLSKAQNLKNTVQKIMLHHAGLELFENLEINLSYKLECLFSKMNRVYERNLKKKCIKGFKQELIETKEQKLQLEAFHEVHTQKIFVSEWKRVLDFLRLENMEEERPLIKKANEYHKVSLLLKSLRGLKENAIESKKEKNINEQKQKIKSKIKNIISQKIEINFDEFL